MNRFISASLGILLIGSPVQAMDAEKEQAAEVIPEILGQELIVAIRGIGFTTDARAQVEKVLTLIRTKRAPVNYTEKQKPYETPLRALVSLPKKANYEELLKPICKWLLEYVANPNYTTDPDKVTLLMTAAFNDHLEICQLLIEKGVPLNSEDKNGKTALRYAMTKNNLDVSKFLIDRMLEVNKEQDKELVKIALEELRRHPNAIRSVFQDKLREETPKVLQANKAKVIEQINKSNNASAKKTFLEYVNQKKG